MKIAKTKKKRVCGFEISDAHGTFLSKTRFQTWKILIFINHFLYRHWDHETVVDFNVEGLEISRQTSVDWRSFSSEVAVNWFKNQPAIGGPGIEVEIDETLITHRKYNRGSELKQVWLFGGIERNIKKKFVVPLLDKDLSPAKRNTNSNYKEVC